MATKKTASKTSKKAEINIDFNKPKKSQTNKVKRNFKKVGKKSLLVALVMLVLGAAGGWFGVKFLTRNDAFEIIGQEEVSVILGTNYEDLGVKVVSFGKDLSDKVQIETNLTQNPDGTFSAEDYGTYYIVYTVDSIKYNSIFKIKKIRLVSFVEESEGTIVD